MLAAMLAVCVFRMMEGGPDHVAFWRVLLAVLAGAAVAAGVARMTDAIGTARRAERRSR